MLIAVAKFNGFLPYTQVASSGRNPLMYFLMVISTGHAIVGSTLSFNLWNSSLYSWIVCSPCLRRSNCKFHPTLWVSVMNFLLNSSSKAPGIPFHMTYGPVACSHLAAASFRYNGTKFNFLLLVQLLATAHFLKWSNHSSASSYAFPEKSLGFPRLFSPWGFWRALIN